MQDAWRAYLELALGLTEASKKKAQQVVRKLVGQGGTTAAQLQALAEELIATSAANRESLTKLVRFEVDRALGVVGLATAEEVADLSARVRDLERELRQAQSQVGAGTPSVVAPDAGGSVGDVALAEAVGEVADAAPEPVAQAVVKKATTRKAVAKKTVAKKTVAKKTVAKKAAGS